MSHSHHRILVAEDNKVNQQVVIAMLGLLGYSHVVVENGRQVLEILKKEHFDLILMDGQMPELDGYQAARQIRDGVCGVIAQDIPIVGVSANVMKEDVQKCLSVGMNDFVGKPIEFDELSEKIKKWLFQSQSVIKKKAIDNLSDLAASGNKNLIKDLVALFKQEAQAELKKLRVQAEAEDYEAAARTAHLLKSSCANLGLYRMQRWTEKIEKLKNAGNREQLLGMIENLEKEYELANAELQKIIITL